jgi:DhnA family fructose-bisphosphate aldolase class Ia
MADSGGVATGVGSGKARRMVHLFRDDGRTVLVALDHGTYLGDRRASSQALRAIARARPDGILASWDVARRYAQEFASAGLVVRLDGGTTALGERSDGHQDADGVVVLAFPGQRDEERSLAQLARVCAEADRHGLVVVAEVIPGGWGREIPWTPENVARAARIAVELGADVIKTVCPEEMEGWEDVVSACPVPVVVLGGPRLASDDDVVAFASRVVTAGAAGIAFGRNVWMADDPANVVLRLHRAVHG